MDCLLVGCGLYVGLAFVDHNPGFGRLVRFVDFDPLAAKPNAAAGMAEFTAPAYNPVIVSAKSGR